MFLRDRSVSSPWLPVGHRWWNSCVGYPLWSFGNAKPNPSSLQRCLGGPDTIPRLAHTVTPLKVPAWTTLLGIAVFGLALLCLHHLLGHYHWRDILNDVHAIPSVKLLRAALFSVAGYTCLTLYDAL